MNSSSNCETQNATCLDKQQQLLFDEITDNDKIFITLKPTLQLILQNWFNIYGENDLMTHSQFQSFWNQCAANEYQNVPDKALSRDLFQTYCCFDKCSWDLNSFLSYFSEISISNPTILLKILLAHDIDQFLNPLKGSKLFSSNYGSVSISTMNDIALFRKRKDCRKIKIMSKVDKWNDFNEFFGKIQSIQYIYQGYKGICVMQDFLKLISVHWQNLKRLEVQPMYHSDYIRLKPNELVQFGLLFLNNQIRLKFVQLSLDLVFVKHKHFITAEEEKEYQVDIFQSIQFFHTALNCYVRYNLGLRNFKYQIILQENLLAQEETNYPLSVCKLTVPARQRVALAVKACQKIEDTYRKEILWDLTRVIFGVPLSNDNNKNQCDMQQ